MTEWNTDLDAAPRAKPGTASISVLLAWTSVDGAGRITARCCGEAYWRHDSDDEGGAWWLANTSPGDYYSDPIIDLITGTITHWAVMPEPPPL